ncbi:MAG: TetR/AcrR family transcriptional regulator [Holdemanella sp.]|nr:TetR/AcrR family transcriptional regulator [Holdemanella sp.]
MKIESMYDESRIKKKKREMILETAFRLFVKEGIEAVSMMEIADACGLQRRTLYNYYNTKEQIALDLMGCWYKDIGTIRAIPNYEGMDSYQKLKVAADCYFEYAITHMDEFIFTFHYDHYFADSESNLFDRNILNVFHEGMIREGVEEGKVNPRVRKNTEKSVYIILSSILSYTQRVFFKKNMQLEEKKDLVRTYIDLCLDTITLTN